MGFQYCQPGAPLDKLIAKVWDWDMPPAAHRHERVLPQPGAQLIINLHEDETRVYTDDAARRCIRSSACVLGGPTLRSEIIDTAEQIRVMGVVFRPGGAHALTGEDATTLIGRDIDLGDLFGRAAALLREQLLEIAAPHDRLRLLTGWLERRLYSTALHPAIAYALDRLSDAPQVQRIAPLVREAGLSERRFGLLFQRQIGMRPKHYTRLLRFRAVVDHAAAQPTVNWSQVAADGGYFDQAHLTHEFRQFAGVTPSAFMAARGPYSNHLPLD
ncbi:helix-turn-helix domain-containing protein [Rhodanobacter lindaniclasticus]|uniref:AraC family transcriptional regulator n=1 Tax=Rhodanobacter lindaniclasticus TaxID=75310 RepID=A0A4S3KF60_9GAMM|nr:helix-turn-helix domain-containing protein [Rhodanobacter lindaniclasticus]THD06574.1 AraC family transcriptional regulator [Rhodanobacter lindaniclasticus]